MSNTAIAFSFVTNVLSTNAPSLMNVSKLVKYSILLSTKNSQIAGTIANNTASSLSQSDTDSISAKPRVLKTLLTIEILVLEFSTTFKLYASCNIALINSG